MPNIANKGNPPKGMVFVFLKYDGPVLAASRYNGMGNVWFKLRRGEGSRKIRLSRFTGCNDGYGISIVEAEHFPMTVNEAD